MKSGGGGLAMLEKSITRSSSGVLGGGIRVRSEIDHSLVYRYGGINDAQ